jgi:hypothetical protein
MPFRLSIHNLLGIWDADLTVEGVTLIAGPNGAGKTSVLQAAAVAMSAHNHWGRGALRNPDLPGGGGVEVSFSSWRRSMMWPGGEITEKGDPPRLSPVTTGAVPFFSLDERRRVAEIGKRVRMEPSPDDLRRALVGFRGLDPTMAPQILAAALEHGWDALHADAEKQIAEGIAEWSRVTGEPHDWKVAAAWHPATINPGIAYRLVDCDVECMSVERRLLDIEALAKVDRVSFDELVERAAQIPVAQRRLNEAVKAQARVEDELRVLERRLDDYEGRGGEHQGKCPCCGEPMALALIGRENKTWHAKDRPVTAGKKAEWMAKRTRKSIGRVQGELAAAAAEVAQAQAARQHAIDADTALRAMSRREDDERTVDDLVKALHAARGRRADFQRWLRAKEIHRDMVNASIMERALSPRGVRKKLIDDALLGLNRKLVDLCDQADLPKVVMDGIGGATVGGKPIYQASESGRWAAEVIIRIAFALIEGATFTTIPSLHTLQPTGRPPFFRMLKATGLDVLVELTPKDRASVPDLHRARLGQAYWIAGGQVEAL